VQKPVLTEEHRKFEKLVGTWKGKEILSSPHTKETSAEGTFAFRLALNGFFLVADYVEKSGPTDLLSGHGVIGWDAKAKQYTMHWFDTYGLPPHGPGRGQWQEGTLMFENGTRGRTIFKLTRDGFTFIVEMNTDGSGWKRAVEGDYRSKEDPPMNLGPRQDRGEV
jgi:hypothetical protein